MKRQTTILTVTGVMLVALTMGATPASAQVIDIPCIPLVNSFVPPGFARVLDFDCCEEFGATNTIGNGLHPCNPCLPHIPNGAVTSVPCDPCQPYDDSTLGLLPHPPCQEPDPCEAFDLQATPLDNGDILLTWNLPPQAEGVVIIRDDGEDEEEIAELPAPAEQYLDEDTEVGQGYEYWVEVYAYDDSSLQKVFTCHAEAVSVPVFGNAATTALAAGLGLLAYVGIRRRM